MSGEVKEIEVFETNRFSKVLDRMDKTLLSIVENEIDKIIDNPLIGVQKKGDLNYLRVHKFTVKGQLYLLGYSWVSGKLSLYLLSIGSHENFYRDASSKRKADLKVISNNG